MEKKEEETKEEDSDEFEYMEGLQPLNFEIKVCDPKKRKATLSSYTAYCVKVWHLIYNFTYESGIR